MRDFSKHARQLIDEGKVRPKPGGGYEVMSQAGYWLAAGARDYEDSGWWSRQWYCACYAGRKFGNCLHITAVKLYIDAIENARANAIVNNMIDYPDDAGMEVFSQVTAGAAEAAERARIEEMKAPGGGYWD